MLFRNIHKSYGIASAVTIASLFLLPLAAFASSPPDTPTDLTATPGDSSASLSWTAPENPGSSSVNGYKIEDSTHNAPLNFNKVFDAGVIATNNGDDPTGNVLSYNGKLYGTTGSGGANEDGVIFSLDPSGNTFTVLHDFSSISGSRVNPSDSLIEVGGILYGTTRDGGANEDGVIFSLDTSNNTFTVLHDFDPATGENPDGSLVDIGGVLYGTADSGGANNTGAIFSYDLTSNTYTDVHDLQQFTEGENPSGTLLNVGGILYGTASTGGADDRGSIFSFDPSDNTFTDVHDFNDDESLNSPAGDLLDVDGVLYGTTLFGGSHGGGTLFSYNISNTTVTTLYSFDPSTDGNDPAGGLIYLNGLLYGTTKDDGPNGSGGTVWSYDLVGNTLSILHSFDNNDPNNVGSMQGGVVNVGGTLYGLTDHIFFSMDPSGSDFALVHLFGDIVTSGGGPGKTLLPYQGLLYGVMGDGGPSDSGVIFSFDPSDNTYHDLYNLNYDADGASPEGGLINVGGIFYGVTYHGGANDGGTIFSFDPSDNTFTNLYDLDPDTDGSETAGNLLDVGGILYGMTNSGGPDGNGVVFSFDPLNRTFTDVHDFNGGDGGFPQGSLINVGGILYGLTSGDDVAQNGTLFSLNPSGNAFNVLHTFDADTDGAFPEADLLNAGGILYGMTNEGGSNNYGTIFSFDPSNTTFTNLHNFDSDTEGDGPYGSLTELGGLLYGITGEGGPGTVGTVFSFDPSNATLDVLHSFNRDADGGFSEGTLVNFDGALYGTINEGGAHEDNGTIFSLGKNWTATQQSGTATTGTVTGLTNGTEYDFRVSATNSTGTGAPSDIATTTPESAGSGDTNNTTPPPTNTITSGTSGQSVRLPITTITGGGGMTTVAALQAQLQALIAQLAAIQGTASSSASSIAAYARDLYVGISGADVTALQNFLIAKNFSIPAGATGYFGEQTQSALAAYQKANGIIPAAGYFGSITRAFISH